MSENEVVECANCGFEGARVRYVSRSYGQGATLFVVEDVPVISCPRCGESYLTAETLQEIERLKSNRHEVAEGRQVEVVKFASPSPAT